MEYQQKKKKILQEVQYKNLLTFTLQENRLERNFQSIVEALLLLQTTSDEVQNDLSSIKSQNQKNIHDIIKRLQSLEKQTKSQPKTSHKALEHHQQSQNDDKQTSQKNIKTISEPQIKINQIASKKSLPSHKSIKSDHKFDEVENTVEELKKERDSTNNELQQMKNKIEDLKKEIQAIKGEVSVLKDSGSRNFQSLANMNSEKGDEDNNSQFLQNLKNNIGKQFNSIYLEINSLKLCVEETKLGVDSFQQFEPKMKNKMEELQKSIKKLQQQIASDQQGNQKKFNQLKIDMMSIEPVEKKQIVQEKKKQSGDITESINYRNNLNDKLSKIQTTLNTFISDNQFQRFKENINKKFTEEKQQNSNNLQELKNDLNNLEQKHQKHQQLFKDVEKLISQAEAKTQDKLQQGDRKNNMCILKCQQLKKGLQNLKEDLEFYKSMSQNETKAPVQVEETKGKSIDSAKSNKNQKDIEEMKKYIHHKLHDQRSYLLGLIRDLEKKMAGNNSYDQEIVSIWDKINEVNLFLNKKINEDDVKKNFGYLQKKLSSLYSYITKTDENNEDARVARTNWFCLSCDKNLQNYQGKVGKHIIWDSMPIKGAGLAKYFKDEKKSLPSIKR